MEQYKGNSIMAKDKTESASVEKKPNKVITKNVTVKKKSDVKKLSDIFLSDDFSKVKSYILDDVLIPSFKKAIDDIVTNGIKILLWGDTAKRSNTNASKVSYSSYYEKDNRDYRVSAKSKRTIDYDDIILESYNDANEVLDTLNDLISQYGVATIGDLYEMVGITGDYTSEKYGWANLANSTVVRVRDGWMLKLPKATAIN